MNATWCNALTGNGPTPIEWNLWQEWLNGAMIL